jgi:alpha-beta hydrolase superfamily lysophospholipase
MSSVWGWGMEIDKPRYDSLRTATPSAPAANREPRPHRRLLLMRLAVQTRWIGAVLLLGVAALNFTAYRQARAFTHFARTGRRTRPQLLSFGEKAGALLTGVVVPRPENRETPRDVGLAYERHVFPGGRGVPLEGWLIPRAEARGTVVLFHGHAASKDSQLREARVFHEMGFDALLVDFYGSGGSGGDETTIGFYEALDVTEAYKYARGLPQGGPIFLYGASMGAAAVLKAVADDKLRPAGLVLECPFDSLITTVRHRFTGRGLPSFPLADLLVFWGGAQEGFNGFHFRPAESASSIDRPTLLMNGDDDPWVRPAEARAIAGALKGPTTLKFFAGVGHDSCLRHKPDEWKEAVREFLGHVLEAVRSPSLLTAGATPAAGSDRTRGR